MLDAYITVKLPPFYTATTGIDALTHAVEAYIGRTTTKETRAYSIEAVQLTVLSNVRMNDPVMQQEIFGPVLPVLTIDKPLDAVDIISRGQRPLALYVFTQNKRTAEHITTRCAFGGGCINDTIIHLATSSMGFGGVGESGMGAYHGKAGFDAFTHYKSIVDKKTWIDLNMRYRPYTKLGGALIHTFLK